jgi:hypothetical protein
MPERLPFPAWPGLQDQTGLPLMAEFCHRTPLARESVTKVRPPCRRPSSQEGGCCGPKCRPKPWLKPRPYASPEGLQVFTQQDRIMNIIAKPTTGSKQPVHSDQQRPLEGPVPANPDTFPGQHAQAPRLAGLSQGSENRAGLGLDGDSTLCLAGGAAGKSPTLRGPPLGRDAVRPPLTPSLNLNSAIVRTTTWGSGCAPLCEYETTPQITGSSMGT